MQEMTWTCFTIHTTEEAEEAVSALLCSLDINNIEFVDNQPVFGLEVEGDYPELYPDLPEDDGSAQVKFYLPLAGADDASSALQNSGLEIEEVDSRWNRDNIQTLLDEIRLRLDGLRSVMDVGSGQITTDETAEEDWENNWKQYFHSFTIGNLLIAPTWEEHPDMKEGQKLLRIDPGLAFGTGAHETTHLVIDQIQKYLKPGDEVLDLGCGSGILTIVSLLYGAGHVVDTDIDPLCQEAVRENLSNNGLGGLYFPDEDHADTGRNSDDNSAVSSDKCRATLYIGDLTTDEKLQKEVGSDRYDIICANILSDILIPMAPAIYRTAKPGGYLLTSGIIDGRENDVADAMIAAGFHLLEKNRLGDWWNVTLVK
jgi:ribosomal protein L11 methyltransferase